MAAGKLKMALGTAKSSLRSKLETDYSSLSEGNCTILYDRTMACLKRITELHEFENEASDQLALQECEKLIENSQTFLGYLSAHMQEISNREPPRTNFSIS